MRKTKLFFKKFRKSFPFFSFFSLTLFFNTKTKKKTPKSHSLAGALLLSIRSALQGDDVVGGPEPAPWRRCLGRVNERKKERGKEKG